MGLLVLVLHHSKSRKCGKGYKTLSDLFFLANFRNLFYLSPLIIGEEQLSGDQHDNVYVHHDRSKRAVKHIDINSIFQLA